MQTVDVECSLVYTMFPRLNDEQIEAFGLKVACGDHVSVDIVDITLYTLYLNTAAEHLLLHREPGGP